MSSGRKDQVTPHRYDMSPQGEGTKEGTREGPAAVASPTSRQPRGPDQPAAAWAGRGGSRVGRTRRQPRGPDEAAAAWAGRGGSREFADPTHEALVRDHGWASRKRQGPASRMRDRPLRDVELRGFEP